MEAGMRHIDAGHITVGAVFGLAAQQADGTAVGDDENTLALAGAVAPKRLMKARSEGRQGFAPRWRVVQRVAPEGGERVALFGGKARDGDALPVAEVVFGKPRLNRQGKAARGGQFPGESSAALQGR